jgi:hypothetical protein
MPVDFDPSEHHEVIPCGDSTAETELWESGRETEFASLVDDQNAPCHPTMDSSKWSCLRYLTDEQIRSRIPEEWGFHNGEQGHREVGDTEDNDYIHGVEAVPNVTDSAGPGFLKMRMTDRMKEVLYPWYTTDRHHAREHGVIGGGYTNSHVVQMEQLELDEAPEHVAIIREMRQVLQWWTNMQLRHTSTFGIRIYKRDSMLVDHFDIASTHIASAVLQIGQDVDTNGGWPLEVKTLDGRTAEVYLQPGEMVLYEGARLKHGRPMRLRGNEFANIFSHFAPLYDWVDPHSTNPNVIFDSGRRDEL